MTKRIFRAVFLTGLLAVLAALLMATAVLYQYFTKEQQEELKTEAAYLSAGLNTGGMEYLQAAGTGNTRITWVDSDGKVLYDNEADAASMENHSGREEIQEALENGTGESSRYSATIARRTYYYAVRTEDGNVLRVPRTSFSIFSIVMGMLSPLALVLLVVLVGSGILASRVSRAIVRPINNIDPEHPEQADAYEELDPLLDRLTRQKRQIGEQMEELRQKQQEFTAITDHMSEGLLLLSPEAEILSYNRSAREIFGVEYTTKRQSVFVWNRSEALRNAVERAQQGHHCEEQLEQNGHVYQLLANPVNREEQFMGILILLLDVTERERWDALRREFTANVSHELKTPLTSISGYAEMMKEGLVPAEDTPQMAERIYHEARRLISLVGDVIELSRLDAGEADQEREKVDLSVLAAQTAAQLAHLAETRKVKIELDTEPAFVYGISRVLEEIIYNLCDNAVKYNQTGGKVWIRIREKEYSIRLRVEDTGIGIPLEDQERVFERFYRVDKSHSREVGGTGLGLSIVKHGVMIHAARMRLESEPGRGTAIQIDFPKEEKHT